ncbi:MAG: pyridoxal 5'-phosphate synthase glutaminase subunit PdxT, partial [Candidatus Zixiibacteriota bacterium]
SRLVKLPEDLNGLKALIVPGGESTTMEILIDRYRLRQPLIDFAARHPIYGTCAGMILFSSNVDDNQACVRPLNLIDIDVARIAYGRQVYSFDRQLELTLNGGVHGVSVSFIRAPRVTRVGPEVAVLASLDASPVLVERGNVLAASFHTELNDDTVLLNYFLRKIRA